MERIRVFIEKLVEYLKEIKNLYCFKIFQNRDYFKIYKNRDVNEFFWLMCILGGILRSKKVCKKLKIFWLIYYISSAILIIAFNIYGYACINEKSFTTILLLLRPICAVFLIFGTHVIVLFFYESLEKYANELDEYLSTSLQQDDHQHAAKTKSQCLDMLFFLFVSLTVFSVGLQFFFPFVIDFKTHSKVLYLICVMCQFFSTLATVIIPCSGLRMRTLYTRNFLCTFYELKNQVKMFSNATLQNLELTHQREMITEIDTNDPEERNYHLNLLTRRKNVIYENVGENIAHFAKQHRKWLIIHLYVKSFFEIICSMIVSLSCLHQVILGFHVLQVIEGRFQFDIWTVRALTFVSTLLYMMNEYCDVVSVFDYMLQEFCDEVYSIPWYLLTTKNRKMIVLLLTQCQDIPQFRIFGMYQFGAPLMPQMLYSVYSYISFLRVVMLKGSQ